jgi:DNA-binding transcriptional ArsR family regulator
MSIEEKESPTGENGGGADKTALNKKYPSANINTSQDDLLTHISILGEREAYCIVGGRYVLSERAKKPSIAKGAIFTEWVLKDFVVDFIREKNAKGEICWLSLNDKETANDTIKGVVGIYIIWFDIDPQRADKNKPATASEKAAAYEEAIKLVQYLRDTFGAIPIIADSGNGYHVYCPIDCFELLTNTQRLEFNDKQSAFFKRIREESCVNIDTTADIRRVTQAIGSLNLKIPQNPLQSKWINAQDFVGHESDVRKVNRPLLLAILDMPIKKEQATQPELQEHPEFETLLKTNTKVKKLYNGQLESFGYKSRSEAEASFITILFREGFTETEISEIMNGCKIGKWQEKKEEGDWYAESQLKSCAKFASEHPKTKAKSKKNDEKRERNNKEPDAEEVSEEAKEKAIAILKEGRALDFVADTVGRLHHGDKDIVQIIWLSSLGVLQEHRIHQLLVGSPGSGKSDTARKVMQTIPAEHKVKLDEASPKALYYAVRDGVNLQGCVIYFDDVSPDKGTIELLKKIASDDPDALRNWTVDDKRQFLNMEIPREVLVVATTIESLSDKQGQLLRRYQILNPDESGEALEGVGEMIKRSGRLTQAIAEPVAIDELEISKAIFLHIINANKSVVIPFDFDYKLKRHADKTTLKGFIALVKCHALANYPNRVCVGDIILATREDLEKASELWQSVLGLKVDKIAEQVLNCLPTHEPIFSAENEEFDFDIEAGGPSYYRATTIAEKLKIAPRTVRDKLINLYEVGLIDRKKEGGRGNPWVSWRAGEAVAPSIAKVKEPSFETDVRDAIKKIVDFWGGNVDEIYTVFQKSCHNQTEDEEQPNKLMGGGTVAPPKTAEDTGSVQVTNIVSALRFFSAPPKTWAPPVILEPLEVLDYYYGERKNIREQVHQGDVLELLPDDFDKVEGVE